MQTASKIVIGRSAASSIAVTLVAMSQWFELEPLPFDKYSFTVKVENLNRLEQMIASVTGVAADQGDGTRSTKAETNLAGAALENQIKVAVFCRDASGQPDIQVVTIHANMEDVDEGRHYGHAILAVEQEGYEAIGAADARDPAWSKLAVNEEPRKLALLALLKGLQELGFGTEDEINGADAVDAIAGLYDDVVERILANDNEIQSELEALADEG